MNPNACRVELRPRNPLEALDLAIRFGRHRAGAFARLAALVLGPVVLLSWVASAYVDGWWVVLALLVLGPILQVPFTVMGGRLLFADRVALSEVLRVSAARLDAGLMAIALHVAAVLIGLLSLGLLWLPARTLVWFAPEARVLEGSTPLAAVRRGVDLSLVYGGKTLLGAMIGVVTTLWVVLATEVALQAVVGSVLMLGQPFGQLQGLVATPYVVAGVVLAQPIAALYRLFLYVDVRTCMDGWDLQVALRAVAEAR